MRLADFDYVLPPALIAQQPAEPRDSARLLVLSRAGESLAHHHVRELPDLLKPGDLLVANRSRVLPARIVGRLAGGGRAELLLLRHINTGYWQALARPARRLRPGAVVTIDRALRIEVVDAHAEGVRDIKVLDAAGDKADAQLLAHGTAPLPPYIKAWAGDPERYQTIYAQEPGSAAAPTAGMHFTTDLIERLAQRGIAFATIVLHVGLDTFRPISVDDPCEHRMHREWYTVPAIAREQIEQTRSDGGRVVAVGTTTVRTLETWAATGEAEGWTDLFVMPGHRFAQVDALLTNFHLPRSTLLMLVSAFAGRELVLAAYNEAVQQNYRFYSFGDAMLVF